MAEREKVRVYRIDPATFITDRKAILEELIIEAEFLKSSARSRGATIPAFSTP